MAVMDDPRDRRIAELEAENAELRRRVAQLEHQLQQVLQRRKRRTGGGPPRQGTPNDRRRKEHRQHPGFFRPEPPPDTTFIEHDVHPKQCSHCGSDDLQPTKDFEDHISSPTSPSPNLNGIAIGGMSIGAASASKPLRLVAISNYPAPTLDHGRVC